MMIQAKNHENQSESILFSIIIPIYNSDRFLEECVSSIVRQNSKYAEIILVDDNSVDRSRDICKKFVKENKSVKCFYNEKNLGVSGCRNRGIEEANGVYLIFLDSDDYLYDGCLENLRKLIDDSLPDVIIGRTYKETLPHTNDYLFDKCIVNNRNPGQLLKHINKINYPTVSCWSCIVKAEFLKSNNIKFIGSTIGEDQYFVMQILCLMKNYASFNSVFYYHRNRAGTLASLTGYLGAYSYLVILMNMMVFKRTNQFSLEKKQFIDNKIESVLESLVLQIIFLEKEDISKLSIEDALLFGELRNKLMELKIIKKWGESNHEILVGLKKYFEKKPC